MHQDWGVRKNHKHYLSCVISNVRISIFRLSFAYVTLSVIYPATSGFSRLACRGLLLIGNTTQWWRDKDGIESAVCATHSTERRRPERDSRRCGSETVAWIRFALYAQHLFYRKRNSSVSSGGSSNCAVSLRTFPTALSTFQAIICSAGKGRSKSNGGCAGSPLPSQRA
jgi:hypothetical protein